MDGWGQLRTGKAEIGRDILKQVCFYDPHKLHQLDVAPLLPFLPKNNKSLGRTVDLTVRDVLEEYLNEERDRYAPLKGGKYLLYIEAQRNLGAFKTEVIAKEIRRRICRIIQEKQEILSEASSAPTVAPTLEAPTVRSRARARRKTSAPPDETSAAASVPPLDYDTLARSAALAYRPVWNVPRKHITAYIARHVCEDLNAGDGRSARDCGLARQRADNDIALLARAATDLARAVAAGRRMVLILPVCFDTLTGSPSREQYLEFCRRVPPQARSLMVLQIRRIPVYAPRERLRDMQREIAGLLRSVIVTTDLRSQNLDCLLERGIHACAVRLPEGADDGHNIALMERFAEKMGAISRAAMIDGISSRATLCAAVSAGFTYISGPALQPDQKTPGAVLPFRLGALYGAP
jgi:hypothetical protein